MLALVTTRSKPPMKAKGKAVTYTNCEAVAALATQKYTEQTVHDILLVHVQY